MNGVCQTRSGLSWNILEPNPEDVRIEDIAHALSNQCRYNGHTKEFYSVAEHSIRVSSCLPEEHRLAGLLHDAAEAYLGDIIRPLKPLLEGYAVIEEHTMEVILDGLGLSHLDVDHPVIDYADKMTMLSTEGRDLMHREEWIKLWPEYYGEEFINSALDEIIIPWNNIYARQRFMDTYMYLIGEPEPTHLKEW